MDMNQLGRFCSRRLEATWGINQDGGGSSALWVDGEIKNRPSDGFERAVANGMLMVVIEPKVSSRAFVRGQQVLIAQDSQVYLGPGTNYAVRSVLRPMTLGVVQDSLNDLDGVLAKGSFWWSVRFGRTDGWVPQEVLIPYDGRRCPPQKWPRPPPPPSRHTQCPPCPRPAPSRGRGPSACLRRCRAPADPRLPELLGRRMAYLWPGPISPAMQLDPDVGGRGGGVILGRQFRPASIRGQRCLPVPNTRSASSRRGVRMPIGSANPAAGR